MISVKILDDIRNLRKRKTLREAYLDYIDMEFRQLHMEYDFGSPVADFSLEDHGYIVVLERGDDVRDLRQVGFNPEYQGILGSIPEWVEEARLEDGTDVYQIAYLDNDGRLMMFFSDVGQYDEIIEEWLRDECY